MSRRRQVLADGLMVRRWLLLIGLAGGAFFVGSYATFFLLFLVTWDQRVLDFFTTAAGISLSAVTFLSTRHITYPAVEPYTPFQRRLAVVYWVAIGVAGILVAFADNLPWWQVALIATASGAAYWLKTLTRGRQSGYPPSPGEGVAPKGPDETTAL